MVTIQMIKVTVLVIEGSGDDTMMGVTVNGERVMNGDK